MTQYPLDHPTYFDDGADGRWLTPTQRETLQAISPFQLSDLDFQEIQNWRSISAQSCLNHRHRLTIGDARKEARRLTRSLQRLRIFVDPATASRPSASRLIWAHVPPALMSHGQTATVASFRWQLLLLRTAIARADPELGTRARREAEHLALAIDHVRASLSDTPAQKSPGLSRYGPEASGNWNRANLENLEPAARSIHAVGQELHSDLLDAMALNRRMGFLGVLRFLEERGATWTARLDASFPTTRGQPPHPLHGFLRWAICLFERKGIRPTVSTVPVPTTSKNDDRGTVAERRGVFVEFCWAALEGVDLSSHAPVTKNALGELARRLLKEHRATASP